MALRPETPSVSRAAAGPDVLARILGVPRGRRLGATALPRSARVLGALALAAAALACDPYVQGNGVYLEVVRDPGPFAGVHVDDRIEVTASVVAGDVHTVRVSSDANVLDYVRTEVQAVDVRGESVGVLRIWVDEPGAGVDPTIPIRAVIEGGSLRYLDAIRASRLEARDVAAPDLDVSGSEGADVVVKGLGGTTLHATLADATADLGAWAVQYADVMLTGRSSLDLRASLTVAGEAHGTSTLENLDPAGVCDVQVFDSAAVTCGPPP